jgi:hypothetical protein
MRLVFRRREYHLRGPQDLALVILGDKQDPLARGHAVDHAGPEGVGLGVCHWQEEAHGGAALDTIHQDC